LATFPAFDRPKQSIAWARDAIHELDAAFTNFFKAKPLGPIVAGKNFYGQIVDIDLETGNEIHKFKVFEPIPSVLSRKVTEALTVTREVWNQAVYAAYVSIDKVPSEKKTFTSLGVRLSPTLMQS